MIYEFWITWAELLFFHFFREFLGPIIEWEILREIIFTRTSGLLFLWGLSIAVMFFFILYKTYILSYGKLTENGLNFYIFQKTNFVWFTSFFYKLNLVCMHACYTYSHYLLTFI